MYTRSINTLSHPTNKVLGWPFKVFKLYNDRYENLRFHDSPAMFITQKLDVMEKIGCGFRFSTSKLPQNNF